MHGWSCSLEATKNGTTIVKIGSAFQSLMVALVSGKFAVGRV